MPGLAAAARWLGGPLIWALHFLLVYASESVTCSRFGGATAHAYLVAFVTAIAVTMLIGLILPRRATARPTDAAAVDFMQTLQLGLGLLSLLAILWAALAAVIIPSCLVLG